MVNWDIDMNDKRGQEWEVAQALGKRHDGHGMSMGPKKCPDCSNLCCNASTDKGSVGWVTFNARPLPDLK